MATVPNWIGNAYVYHSGRLSARKVLHWRPTATQVVVEVESPRGTTEMRFRLDDLTEVGKRYGGHRLISGDDDRVADAIKSSKMRAVRDQLDSAIHTYNEGLRRGHNTTAESMCAAISNVQRAATKAMADLAELL